MERHHLEGCNYSAWNVKSNYAFVVRNTKGMKNLGKTDMVVECVLSVMEKNAINAQRGKGIGSLH